MAAWLVEDPVEATTRRLSWWRLWRPGPPIMVRNMAGAGRDYSAAIIAALAIGTVLEALPPGAVAQPYGGQNILL